MSACVRFFFFFFSQFPDDLHDCFCGWKSPRARSGAGGGGGGGGQKVLSVCAGNVQLQLCVGTTLVIQKKEGKEEEKNAKPPSEVRLEP